MKPQEIAKYGLEVDMTLFFIFILCFFSLFLNSKIYFSKKFEKRECRYTKKNDLKKSPCNVHDDKVE